jgi:NTP pyrophosphatase (non-canonical NTP hydrolase)
MDLEKIQSLANEWHERNFDGHVGTGYQCLLGVTEEVGELCHAQLKGEQGIRHTPEEIKKMKMDAVGDIVIFLSNYCTAQKLSLNECVELAWNEVKDRDWKKKNVKPA